MRYLALLIVIVFSPLCLADANVDNLDQLLSKARQHQSAEKVLLQQREQRFLQTRDAQKRMVDEAQSRFLALQQKNNPLLKQSAENQQLLTRLQQELAENSQDLGDIYSVYTEFSGDFIARMRDSYVKTQFPEREVLLSNIESSATLPNIEDMREFFLLVQEEMTEAGKITQFSANVTQADGKDKVENIWRIGTFSLFNAQYLLKAASNNALIPQQRQSYGISNTIKQLNNAAPATWVEVPIDPSRGELIGLMDKSPSLRERIQQGAEVGYMIIALGVAGLLLAFYRIGYLVLINARVKRQLQQLNTPRTNNPLGRLLLSTRDFLTQEELLQQKLQEAVLKELPILERGHSLLKLMAAIAPLLGLLGTVVGMIATFQSISLFGSGDPKLMAGGISQALVTTVQGLLVAIPLLFLHNIVSGLGQRIAQVLEQQSAGILANMVMDAHHND